ncbi:MAG: 2-amino-4-hydroxy-6-hydroxymethyldihydropteridine diphosphokinase [Candidatus Latescibacteria bacterium]|nr:2-amino-4-hydroxy-6-hydroxymethyldihydropteridine diphosphokinase [Candidatus Latescibacterota bacterium]
MKNNHNVTAFIGVGSNISPEINIENALKKLAVLVTVTGISTFYRTKPLAGKNQDDYLNGVWRIITSVSPEELKNSILNVIERDLKRIRTEDTYAARTIDLDVLLYGDLVVRQTNLTIPDPDIYSRAFIAVPLYELEPDLILPDSKKPIAEIIHALSDNTLRPENDFTRLLKRRIPL